MFVRRTRFEGSGSVRWRGPALKLIVLPITFMLLAGGPAAVALSPGPAVHGVVGSGVVELPGISVPIFGVTVSASQNAAGLARGTAVLVLHYPGISKPTVATVNVTCLLVEGNSAWLTGPVVKSTNLDTKPLGERQIIMIRDLGGPGTDIMHWEVAFPDETCNSQTALNPTVVKRGDYKVR